MSEPTATTLPVSDVALLAHPDDNVAVALRRLEAGTRLSHNGRDFTLSHTLMEGHRFTLRPITRDESVLSWARPFGRALRDIQPGEYLCNQGMIDSLSLRHLDFALPAEPNFTESYQPLDFAKAQYRVTEQIPLLPESERRTFPGYLRPGGRTPGIRNYIVLLGVNATVAGFVRKLESVLQSEARGKEHLHGIVAVAHTEGDVPNPNNLEFILRTLAGHALHPNAAAVLLVDASENDPVSTGTLTSWMTANGYPLEHIPHARFRVSEDFATALDQAAALVRPWIPEVAALRREPIPAGAINIGLQCGGSDAFSGISANPLIGWVGRELIRHGGAANIAETDELIGAEDYMIEKVRSPEVAHDFLKIVEVFRQRAAWHGANAEGNPTGGNKFRGLYNIYLKSMGAAMKKSPDLRLDHAIGYSVPMKERGYFFMDSPGNDLESVSGQAASGCHVILFTTGNGSITNHPLSPTIKVVTTTRRFELLSRDMDVNAGRYLDGTPMDDLGQETFDLLLEVCGGRLTVGEKAGHSQVQVWRNWRRTAPGPAQPASPVRLPGAPIPLPTSDETAPDFAFPLVRQTPPAAENLGLIMPTSLCAGSIAQMAATRLNQRLGNLGGMHRYLALPHTEGCCVSQNAERLYPRTVLSCVTHPSVARCLLLEHGCEVTHNDYMREEFAKAGLDPAHFGWASIQMDGGIDKVLDRIESWFRASLENSPLTPAGTGHLRDLRLALVGTDPAPAPVAGALARMIRLIVTAGGTVIVPETSPLLQSPAFLEPLDLDPNTARPTLAYAQPLSAGAAGFHIMAMPTAQWTETLVGLSGGGVQLIAAFVTQRALSGIPLVPVLQFSAPSPGQPVLTTGIDLLLDGPASDWPAQLLTQIAQTLTTQFPAVRRLENETFQITRGELAVTL